MLNNILMLLLVSVLVGCGGGSEGETTSPDIDFNLTSDGYPKVAGLYEPTYNECSTYLNDDVFEIAQNEEDLVFMGIKTLVNIYGEIEKNGDFVMSYHHDGRFDYDYDATCDAVWSSATKFEMTCNGVDYLGDSDSCRFKAQKVQQ